MRSPSPHDRTLSGDAEATSTARDADSLGATLEATLADVVPFLHEMPPADRQRLEGIAASLRDRGLPESFVSASLRSTAQVLREIRSESDTSNPARAREPARESAADEA